MTNRTEPATRPTEVGQMEFAEFLEFGPPLRIKPGAIEIAIGRAKRARAEAFRETIGALWRHAPHHHQDAALHA